MPHPYSDLPGEAFWRTAVSEKSPLQFSALYRKKFSIFPNDVIATAGSCFAQHIARHLVRNGYNFRDFEKAPPFIPEKRRSEYGYGIYSARYANIYTVRQLLQTLRRAFGHFTPQEQVWGGGGNKKRFYDPFRPAIEPNGFCSRDELDNARHSHLDAVRRMFTNADIFVFTLGLTEAWVARADGAVYPTCPGTIAGTFDESAHAFHNFTVAEILSDFELFIEELRRINPGIRLLLTVSPVPLTATASGKHVMVASSYSKSVLRAVAGQLADTHDFIDYFPSYELVAAHPMRAMFFEPNLRAVANEGVELVMKHFFAEHGAAAGERKARKAQDGTKPNGSAVKSRRRPVEDEDDVVCEEMLLDQGL